MKQIVWGVLAAAGLFLMVTEVYPGLRAWRLKMQADAALAAAQAKAANSTLEDLRKAARSQGQSDTVTRDDKAEARKEWDAYYDCKVAQRHGSTSACSRPNSPNPY